MLCFPFYTRMFLPEHPGKGIILQLLGVLPAGSPQVKKAALPKFPPPTAAPYIKWLVWGSKSHAEQFLKVMPVSRLPMGSLNH